jgi:ribonuclease HI
LAVFSFKSQGAETMKKQSKTDEKSRIRVFTDGAGCRPDGTGSGFVWLREDTREKKVFREPNLTNNQAEYSGIRAAIEALQSGEQVEILTDSQNTCCQLKGEHRVRDARLAALHDQILKLIQKKRIDVIFTWIPRSSNPAGKLI